MGGLKEHIKSSITVDPREDDYSVWQEFLTVLDDNDLESSLQKVILSDSLLKNVILATWELLNSADLRILESIVRGEQQFALTELYRFLFNSTHRTISVITTNYDRIAEYSADLGGFVFFNGFGTGYLKFPEKMEIHKARKVRTVNIWKVHGSLDWFKRPNRSVFSAPPRDNIPSNVEPCIVSPGVTKFQTSLQEPFRTVITCSDDALEHASSYLCIGYGFNDEHIQPKLIEKVQNRGVPIIVLSRTITRSARDIILNERCKEFLALEKNGSSGTRVYSSEYPDGLVLNDISLWKLDEFLNVTIKGE